MSQLPLYRAQLKASNKFSSPSLCADSGALKAVQVTQLDRDTVLIALESKFLPSKHMIQILQSSSTLIHNLLYLNVDARWTETVKVVNLRGLPSKELAPEMVFDFPIETLGRYNHVINTANKT